MEKAMRISIQTVFQQLKQREYTIEQTQGINRKLSAAQQAVVNRVEDFINQDYERVEREIEQLEQQLLEKLAERQELLVWCHRIGYRTGEIQFDEGGEEHV